MTKVLDKLSSFHAHIFLLRQYSRDLSKATTYTDILFLAWATNDKKIDSIGQKF